MTNPWSTPDESDIRPTDWDQDNKQWAEVRVPWEPADTPWPHAPKWNNSARSSSPERIAQVSAASSPDADMYSYRKVTRIAVQGQGEVWKVQREGASGMFAQKFLLQTSSDDDVKRFHREVRTQSALMHPGIMPIFAVDFESVPPWYVMPLADYSLRDRLKNGETFSEDDSVALVLQVASALGHGHHEGVIHRDVKPENILWLDGRWVVSDFGLCRDYTAESTTVTRTGTTLGTLPYMAPEQWTAPHNVGARADVYGVGKVLYECLTGELPWPTVKPELVQDRFKYIVSKCLDVDPVNRYPSLDALVVDLTALAAPEDLTLPIEYAQSLAGRVAANDYEAVPDLLKFILKNLSDEVFLRNFLPSITPPVLASLRQENLVAFHQIVKAFDRVATGSQVFSWTDSAATFLERVFIISSEAEIRELVLKRLLILGTEHNRWAVREVYVRIISGLSSPQEVLMVATQLSGYPEGAKFIRPAVEDVSLPLRIQQAVAA